MKTSHETLGTNIVPIHYSILIEPDFSTFEFDGTVDINTRISKKTNKITLNASELSIDCALVISKNKKQEAKVTMDMKKERAELSLPQPVSGEVAIKITFKGKNTDSLNGFYRSKYSVDGKDQYILTTQFEAASARKAFPCFDEPSFKATFDLSLLVDKKLECVSNMPIKTESIEDGKKRVTFLTTPKMSTYLLYIGVGMFDRLTGSTGSTKLSVITTKGKAKYAKLPFEYAKKLLPFYEKYLGMRYPLKKLDLIAVPDFAAGAMENWGAITFRETDLLGDSKSAVLSKQRIASVIAHEMAHQWFGDLVTMSWWDDLWLNESFATFMGDKAVNSTFPEWNTHEQYLSDMIDTALSADQLANTHPISVTVNTPAEIDQVFDEISYEKGGSVLNMLESYVGKEAFRKGLRNYLNKHAYSNALKQDLWNAIANATSGSSNSTITQLISSWIDQPGYPLVTVTEENNTLLLKQKRFMLSGKTEREKWIIPINYKTVSNGKDSKLIMKDQTQKLCKKMRWVKLNYGQSAPYRVAYPQDMLDALGERIRSGEMENMDSWGIENDLFALARGSRLPLTDYLDFVNNYCFASRYPLNISVLSHIRGVYSRLYPYNNELKKKSKELLRSYSGEIIKQVGWARNKNENNITTITRSAAISASGISEDPSTLKKAESYFKLIKSGNDVDSNIRGTVYGIMAWNGNSDTLSYFKDRYIDEEVPEEKRRLLGAMGMFKNEDLVLKSLDFSMSNEVRYQDSYLIPALVSMNPSGRRIMWVWTKKNWPRLLRMHSVGTHMIGRYVDNLASEANKKTITDMKSFFKGKNFRDDIRIPLSQAIELIGINARFLEYNGVM
jgi:tricorn protease interacting factor F2/3